jgi:uncharacterized protein (TIGR00369 family)
MSAPLTHEQLQAWISEKSSGQGKLLGLRLLATDPANQEVTLLAPFRSEYERGEGSGQWHGGPIASVIDTAGDFALLMVLGRGLPTINLRIDYFRPAVKTDLKLVARVRRNGRSVGVADVDAFDNAGNLVAIGRAAYSTLAP